MSTKSQVVAALREAVSVLYYIECGRCKRRFEHEFAVAPKGQSDRTYVANMALEDGWAVAGSIYRSNGEFNGDIVTDPVCSECMKPVEKTNVES